MARPDPKICSQKWGKGTLGEVADIRISSDDGAASAKGLRRTLMTSATTARSHPLRPPGDESISAGIGTPPRATHGDIEFTEWIRGSRMSFPASPAWIPGCWGSGRDADRSRARHVFPASGCPRFARDCHQAYRLRLQIADRLLCELDIKPVKYFEFIGSAFPLTIGPQSDRITQAAGNFSERHPQESPRDNDASCDDARFTRKYRPQSPI
jgi:hypothetical protein